MRYRSRIEKWVLSGLMILMELPVPSTMSVAEERSVPPHQALVHGISLPKNTAGGNGSVGKISPELSAAMQELDWRLIGTAVSDAPGTSIAIIEFGPSRSQRVCREGDWLANILIKEIQDGKVIASTPHGDALLLIKGGLAGISGPAQQPAGRVTREEIEQAFPDYQRLMEAVRFRAYFEGGRANGFVIYNIQVGSIFERIGIENGDVIFNLNGGPFETTQPMMEFYSTLKTARTFSMDIKRGDDTRALRVEIF